MATFTRESVLLKWSNGAITRAFYILREGYGGGDKEKPASYDRSLYDNSLLRVYGTTYRRLTGFILVQDSPSGTVDGASLGSIAELEAAWAATDLQVKSFEDSDYWDAEWTGAWTPALDYDPVRGYAAAPITLEQR